MKRILQAIGLLTIFMVLNVCTFLIMFGTPQSRAQEPNQPTVAGTIRFSPMLKKEHVAVLQQNAPAVMKIAKKQEMFDSGFIEVQVKNTGEKDITDIRIGVILINQFNEYVATVLNGSGFLKDYKATVLSVDSQLETLFTAKPTIVHAGGYRSAGVVWIDSLRFTDNSVWYVDRASLLPALKEILPEATLEML